MTRPRFLLGDIRLLLSISDLSSLHRLFVFSPTVDKTAALLPDITPKGAPDSSARKWHMHACAHVLLRSCVSGPHAGVRRGHSRLYLRGHGRADRLTGPRLHRLRDVENHHRKPTDAPSAAKAGGSTGGEPPCARLFELFRSRNQTKRPFSTTIPRQLDWFNSLISAPKCCTKQQWNRHNGGLLQ